MDATLEQRVISAIAKGYVTFTAIDTNSRRTYEGTFRSTDRILQRLRRQGVLGYSRKTGWALAQGRK